MPNQSSGPSRLVSLAPDASEEGARKFIISYPKGSIFLLFGSFWLTLSLSVYIPYTLLSCLSIIYHVRSIV